MADKIDPPKSLLIPMNVPTKLLMGPGPSNCSTNILTASSRQMLGHLDEDFLKIMEDVKKGIQYAFQTTNRMTFAVSGTGHCAMETAIINLLEPDDTFLVASPGIWGDRAKNIAERIGAKCYKINSEANCAIDLVKLEEIVGKIKPEVCFICHGDSSTGVLQPLNGIGDMLMRHDCLLIVDAVASLGAIPIFMDISGIDVLYTGSQKILNAPPGLSPMSFSPKAVSLYHFTIKQLENPSRTLQKGMAYSKPPYQFGHLLCEKVKARKSPVTSFYMDCLLIGNYWNCDDDPIIYHHTAPINLVYALREALSLLAKETLEKSWEKHRQHAELLYKHLQEMGLTLFITEKVHRLPSVTAVKIPKHISGTKVVENMRKRFNIDIAGGLGSTAGKVWRIGLMGYNCNAENVSKTVDALLNCINSSTLNSNL